ncbi:hypothetical protein [Pontibacter sp. G13]|uniref:hypothetical protein n=1 Tax=Pontibacter sp. G13 TaxID=3074898 RepID=UPI0028894ACF|nr:hypothetical protein [Pontibacter sp. G13]WNJ21161.1 hypothetical protein RJD25_11895 [Pontibacter sp. G13]
MMGLFEMVNVPEHTDLTAAQTRGRGANGVARFAGENTNIDATKRHITTDSGFLLKILNLRARFSNESL